MRSTIEHWLRRLPIARNAYGRLARTQAELEALHQEITRLKSPEAVLPSATSPDPLSLVAQVGSLSAPGLADLVPPILTVEERVLLATRCRDADMLPKTPGAGSVVNEADGTRVQIMYNGIRVLAGGYYGDWMQDLILRCRGHHEPQEEVLVAEVLSHVGSDATMLELGGFWSFYSLSFLRDHPLRRAFVVEADPAHLAVGRRNAGLNALEPHFTHAFVGAAPVPPTAFATEASGTIDLPCVSVASMMETHGLQRLDLLHCDAQGVELAVLQSCASLAAAGRLNWVVVSTHHHSISGDPLTHQRCVAVLVQAGATILCEHDVSESFSGDGLIVAKFGEIPPAWRTPAISANRASQSLFRHPLYDLDAATGTITGIPSAVTALPRGGPLVLCGGRLALTADGALGRKGDVILLPFDDVMWPWIVNRGSWEVDNQDFLAAHIDPSKTYDVVDVGANVGLFSRQAALRFPNLRQFLCAEADARNLSALLHNIGGLLRDRLSVHEVALSSVDGDITFYRDDANFGNYSLNPDAMRDRSFNQTTVRSVATGPWLTKHLPDGRSRLLWKSDTQGHDEVIVSNVPMEIWARVDIAIIELWRIRKPAFDRDAFAERVAAFPNRTLGDDTGVSVDDIMRFAESEDWRHTDLYLWR